MWMLACWCCPRSSLIYLYLLNSVLFLLFSLVAFHSQVFQICQSIFMRSLIYCLTPLVYYFSYSIIQLWLVLFKYFPFVEVHIEFIHSSSSSVSIFMTLLWTLDEVIWLFLFSSFPEIFFCFVWNLFLCHSILFLCLFYALNRSAIFFWPWG